MSGTKKIHIQFQSLELVDRMKRIGRLSADILAGLMRIIECHCIVH